MGVLCLGGFSEKKRVVGIRSKKQCPSGVTEWTYGLTPDSPPPPGGWRGSDPPATLPVPPCPLPLLLPSPDCSSTSPVLILYLQSHFSPLIPVEEDARGGAGGSCSRPQPSTFLFNFVTPGAGGSRLTPPPWGSGRVSTPSEAGFSYFFQRTPPPGLGVCRKNVILAENFPSRSAEKRVKTWENGV